MGGEGFPCCPFLNSGQRRMGMGNKPANYDRLRYNTGQHRRIGIIAILLGVLAFIPVTVQLFNLMVRDYDYYARLALRNQTRSTQVTADRGFIYDRNMNILATSVHVENVYLDPHELKQSKADIPEISRVLAQLLDSGEFERHLNRVRRRKRQEKN